MVGARVIGDREKPGARVIEYQGEGNCKEGEGNCAILGTARVIVELPGQLSL